MSMLMKVNIYKEKETSKAEESNRYVINRQAGVVKIREHVAE